MFLQDAEKASVPLAQPWCAKTHLSPSLVLASLRSSTGIRTHHHSAARTNVVFLIRRTVRPRGCASGLHSLRPCCTAFLSILQEWSAFGQDLQVVGDGEVWKGVRTA